MYVCSCVIILYFMFKQKTAYEMRISDWSSDVCSSDLRSALENDVPRLAGQSVTCGVAGDQFPLAKRRVRNRGKPPHDRLADMRPNARVAQDRLQVGEIAAGLEFAFECEDLPRLGSAKQRLFACSQEVAQRLSLLHDRTGTEIVKQTTGR